MTKGGTEGGGGWRYVCGGGEGKRLECEVEGKGLRGVELKEGGVTGRVRRRGY